MCKLKINANISSLDLIFITYFFRIGDMQEQIFCRIYNICFKSQCSFHVCHLCEKLAYLTLMYTQIRTNPIRSRLPSGDFASSWFLIDCQACFTMTKWDIIILSGINGAVHCRYPKQGYKKTLKVKLFTLIAFFQFL